MQRILKDDPFVKNEVKVSAFSPSQGDARLQQLTMQYDVMINQDSHNNFTKFYNAYHKKFYLTNKTFAECVSDSPFASSV